MQITKKRLREKYSKKLRKVVVSKCVNQAAMASKLGVSKQHLNGIINGRYYPSQKLHTKINQFLNITLPYTGGQTK